MSIQRKDIDGATQRARVFEVLGSFDAQGMAAAEFEQQTLALLDLPGVRDAAGTLAYYRHKFRDGQLAAACITLPHGTDRASADAVLDHRFTFYGESCQLPATIDWEYNPGNRHWGHDLNRFSFLLNLTQAFQETHDLRYARKAVTLILDWIATTDVCDAFIPKKSPYVWGSYLNIGIHLEVWVQTLATLLRDAPELISAPDWLRILKSMHDQLAYLQIVIPEMQNNWMTIGSRCILTTLATLGEWRAAPEWTRGAWQYLQTAAQNQVLPDGVQDELTPAYHRLVAENFLLPLSVQHLLPAPAPPELRTILKGMLAYVRQTITPDGKQIAFNDTDPEITSKTTATLAHPITRELLGAEADAELRSQCYPYGGVMILRQGSRHGKDELYLAFDGGPFGMAHQHEDKLGFWLSAYGRSLIVDPGRHLYDTSERSYGPYLKTTRAHSTIMIDGHGQYSRAHRGTPNAWRAAAPLPLRWHIDEQGGVEAGASYDLGYGRDLIPVRHQRTIRFVPSPGYWIIEDEITGAGQHDIESRFQFAPGTLAVTGWQARTNYPDANLLLAARPGDWDEIRVECGQENPRAGWYSPSVNQISPAPALVLIAKARPLPHRSRVILYPYRGTQPPADALLASC